MRRQYVTPFLLLTLTGCIVTYRDFPHATLESLPKEHEPKPFYYHVAPIVTQIAAGSAENRERAKGVSRLTAFTFLSLMPGWYPHIPQVDPVGQPGHNEVERTLKASGLFSDLIAAPDPPETGVYCYVDFESREPSPWVTGYFTAQVVAGYLSLGLLMPVPIFNLLPYYTGQGGTTAIYTLYSDGRHKQTYRYPITKKGAGWIALLPLAWINFFTYDLKDAVRATTLQFLIDAERDGYLQ